MNHPDSPDPMPSDPGTTANPSFPAFQSPEPAQQPQPGPSQDPYGQHPTNYPPYGQTPPPYVPYGQTPPPYGAIPPPGGLKRPGTATAASVLGIVSGSLGIVIAAGALNGAFNNNQSANSSGPVAATTTWLLTLAIVAAVAGLFTGGILFLKGKGYKTLLTAVISQIVLTTLVAAVLLLGVVFFAQIAEENSSAAARSAVAGAMVVAIFYGLVGLGLSVTNLVLLLRPATRQWAKQVS